MTNQQGKYPHFAGVKAEDLRVMSLAHYLNRWVTRLQFEPTFAQPQALSCSERHILFCMFSLLRYNFLKVKNYDLMQIENKPMSKSLFSSSVNKETSKVSIPV